MHRMIHFIHGLIVAIIAQLVLLDQLAAEPWPQFRGPTADGQTTAKGIPVAFNESLNVRWKTAVAGKAWSSPVVWGQQIWMTTATADGSELGAICIDAESGRIVHEPVVFKIAKPQFCHPMNSYGTPTPVIEAGRVYLHFGSHGSACLDTATAAVLWSRQDLPCDHYRGAASSPVLVNNLLVLTFDGVDNQYLAALDKATGKTVWKHDRKITYDTDNKDYHKAYSTPAIVTIDGHAQIISPSAGATAAYDATTGEEAWRIRSGGMNAAALPLIDDGLIFATTAASGYQLFAARTGGHGDVTDTHVVWKFAKSVPTRSSPILANGRLFMISDNGMISCVDAKSGQLIWQHKTKGAFSASPICAEGRIYFFGEDGEIPVIAATDTYQLLSENHLDDGFMASPAVYGNALILRTRKHVYRIEQPTP